MVVIFSSFKKNTHIVYILLFIFIILSHLFAVRGPVCAKYVKIGEQASLSEDVFILI